MGLRKKEKLIKCLLAILEESVIVFHVNKQRKNGKKGKTTITT